MKIWIVAVPTCINGVVFVRAYFKDVVLAGGMLAEVDRGYCEDYFTVTLPDGVEPGAVIVEVGLGWEELTLERARTLLAGRGEDF